VSDGIFNRRDFVVAVTGLGAAAAVAACRVPGADADETGGGEAGIAGGEGSPQRVVNVRDFGAAGDGQTEDREAANRALREVSGAGGGVVFFPGGRYPVRLEVPDDVFIVGTPDTVLLPASPHVIVRLDGERCGLMSVRVSGARLDDPQRGRSSHCIEVRGSEVLLDRVTSGGARFDSLYIRADHSVVARRCSFQPSARNSCSIVRGHGISFEDCSFHQDRSIRAERLSGLYLYDIEPNRPDEVWDVSHIRCRFRNDLQDGYGGVILHARPGGRDSGVLFHRCEFLRGDRTATVIRPTGAPAYHGLTLVENRFEGGVLTNPRLIRLRESALIGNRHDGGRFSYNVRLEDVALIRHRGGGWSGFSPTAATAIVDVEPRP